MVQAVALMCVFGLGMCFCLLGSISVKLMPRVKIDEAKFGTLISIFMASCLVASLLIGVITDAIGYKWVAVFGFAATAISVFILAFGKDYLAVVIPCILLGFGAMSMNTAGNVMAAHVLFGGQDAAAASNLANVFFGLGLFVTPMLVSFLFRKTSYEKAVSALGIIIALPIVIALAATNYPASGAKLDVAAAVKLLGEPAVLVASFVLFCYMALETSFCSWLPAFGKEVVKKEDASIEPAVADARGQRLLSWFAIAMMAGRLVTGLVPARMGIVLADVGGGIIAIAALIAAVGIFLMMSCSKGTQAALLAALAGFVFAPIFPTTVGVTFSKFPVDVLGAIFGIMFAVGLLGSVIVPKAMGNIAKGGSIQKSLKLLLPACALLLILALVLGRMKGQ
ncbi:MAG: MFS transporter [Planctomycetaceae bacterium]|nr:MFS transporter [Planctomycetaceae bacterium]